jgi:hypothetical protein
MATENIVLLTCAAVLCTLHVAGGPLSGLFRKSSPRKRPVVREYMAPEALGFTDERPRAEPAPMTASDNEAISRAS